MIVVLVPNQSSYKNSPPTIYYNGRSYEFLNILDGLCSLITKTKIKETDTQRNGTLMYNVYNSIMEWVCQKLAVCAMAYNRGLDCLFSISNDPDSVFTSLSWISTVRKDGEKAL